MKNSMRVYFRKPDGTLRIYEADIQDHHEAIEAVRQYEHLPQNTVVLAVLDGSKTAGSAS